MQATPAVSGDKSRKPDQPLLQRYGYEGMAVARLAQLGQRVRLHRTRHHAAAAATTIKAAKVVANDPVTSAVRASSYDLATATPTSEGPMNPLEGEGPMNPPYPRKRAP